MIGQIKNVSQERQKEQESVKNEEQKQNIIINSFDDLLNICNKKRELQLKYELEKNVSLVSFKDKKIEISFNENLDKNFVKELSLKLFEWTGQRWIIAFSKKIGQPTKKQKESIEKSKTMEEIKNKDMYKRVLETFPDAELIDVKFEDNE